MAVVFGGSAGGCGSQFGGNWLVGGTGSYSSRVLLVVHLYVRIHRLKAQVCAFLCLPFANRMVLYSA